MEQPIERVLHDRYRIQSLLGRQTGRRTFLAEDLQTNSPVVVKLLLFGQDFTWDDLKLFQREAETLKVLDHRAIPKYLDSFDVNTKLGKGFALVQSYIKARSLQDCLESGRSFSEEEIKAIAKELLEILTYLHDCQPPVIHRDIKPSNILLGDRSGNSPGQVYLVDFGSVQTANHAGTMTVVGTYGYMPPEQFGGRTNALSDLYSLGATLIYLTTGQHPTEFMTDDLRLEFKQSTQLSPQFTYWLRRMIQPSPSQRFPSAAAALEALNDPQFGLSERGSSIVNLSKEFSLARRPNNAEYKVNKNDNKIEIIAPTIYSDRRDESTCLIIAIVIIVFASLKSLSIFLKIALLAPSINILMLSKLVFFMVFIGLMGNHIYHILKRRTSESGVVLEINTKQISRVEKYAGSSKVARSFKKAKRSEIRKLMLVCKGEHCRVEIATDYLSESNFVIGNGWSVKAKNFLIAKKEAEWLVSELSYWLRIPVSEVRVEEG